jgi:diguanylate cyclase (GGDEF)-like protein
LTRADAAVAAHQHNQDAEHQVATDPVGLLRPEAQVGMMAGLMALATLGMLFVIPDRSLTIEPAGWWAFAVTAAMFGLFEYTVFNISFRREGLSFSLSEMPLAFALVFLSPVAALIARVPISVFVLVVARKNRGYKLAFNASLVAFELVLAILLLRSLFVDGTSSLLLLLAVTLVGVAPLTSVLISLAISRFEGGARERIVGELRATWWMYTVNSVLSAMTVGLALVEPVLALLAVLPVAGIWFVLHSYGELGQELRDLDAVHGFAGRVGSTLVVDEIGEVAAAEVLQLLRAEGIALVRFTDGGTVVHVRGEVPVQLPTSAVVPGWKSVIEGEGVQVIEAPRLRELGIEVGASVPALMVAPVSDGSEVLAVLVAVQRDVHVHRFDDGDVARLTNIAHQLAVSLRRGMLHERLEYEARHDALTDLPARTLFERYVAEVVAEPREGVWVVMMLDLDRFKEVNDTLGHHAGDDLLVQFSRRMSALLRPGDQLARLAGDEFAILCRRDSDAEILEMAQQCVREGGRPVDLDGLEIVVTVSVGVADITDDDVDALQPMRRADIAMYNAKWQRTGVELYRDEIDRRTPARLSMLGDLRTAIETDQLDVVYQPKLDLLTGVVVGVEALVRWDHETRGMVAPTEFVRVAEDTGLIKELTDLVLARGISTLRTFEEMGLALGLAVNLSTHDLFDARLPDRVRGYLESNGVDASLLTLEITESSLLIDAPRTRATIDELHAVGLRLAVDDFGTGYSSLSYLRRLPVHELKIDQSFVSGMLTDPQDEVIVRSTVDLGHNLGLRVVAEGVESREVLDRLREMGCDIAQGYGISEPLSAADLRDWVRRIRATVGPPMSWVGAGK